MKFKSFISKKFMALVLSFSAIICLLCSPALAATVEEEDVVPAIGKSTTKLSWRTYKIPFVELQASNQRSVEYYRTASVDGQLLGGASEKEKWRYISTVDNFYCFALTFEGLNNHTIAFVPKSNAKLVSTSKTCLVRKAGTYQVAGKNSDTTLRGNTLYYMKALNAKATVVISSDKQGRNKVMNESFTSGMIIKAITTQYITFKNSELLPVEVAPTSILNDYLSPDEEVLDEKVSEES